jgi:hypothetical protein
MSFRTTASAIRGIVEVDAEFIDASLVPFIESASAIVDDVLADQDLSDLRLELIERWLAAHFYVLRDPRRKSETVGPITQTLEMGKTGLHLQATQYGQTAMLLDSTGSLAQYNANLETPAHRLTVGVRYLGKVPDTSELAT